LSLPYSLLAAVSDKLLQHKKDFTDLAISDNQDEAVYKAMLPRLANVYPEHYSSKA
jgi:hypothetical protein